MPTFIENQRKAALNFEYIHMTPRAGPPWLLKSRDKIALTPMDELPSIARYLKNQHKRNNNVRELKVS